LRVRIPPTLKTVNKLREPTRRRIGRVSMNERGYPCTDHATARAQIAIAAAKYAPIHPFFD